MRHIVTSGEVLRVGWRSRATAFIVLGLVLLGRLLPVATWAAERQTLRGHVVRAVTEFHLPTLGNLASETNLELVIGLPLRNPEALTNLLRQQYAPKSPKYHHWLTPYEFTAMFAPTEEELPGRYRVREGERLHRHENSFQSHPGGRTRVSGAH